MQVSNPDQEARDFLNGGGGAKSIFNKHDAVGTVRRITITSWKMQQQQDPKTKKLKTYDDGNPMMQLVVSGSNFRDQHDNPIRTDTDDNGERRVFVKGDLKIKVTDALRNAGEDFIARGGILTVARVDKEPDQGVIDGAWIHQCHYQPPAQNFLAPATGGQAAAAAAAPVNLAPPLGTHTSGDILAAQARDVPATPTVQEAQDAAIAAAQANLANAGMTSPPPAAEPSAATSAATSAPGLDPAVAAALANLPADQRAAVLAQMSGQ